MRIFGRVCYTKKATTQWISEIMIWNYAILMLFKCSFTWHTFMGQLWKWKFGGTKKWPLTLTGTIKGSFNFIVLKTNFVYLYHVSKFEVGTGRGWQNIDENVSIFGAFWCVFRCCCQKLHQFLEWNYYFHLSSLNSLSFEDDWKLMAWSLTFDLYWQGFKLLAAPHMKPIVHQNASL